MSPSAALFCAAAAQVIVARAASARSPAAAVIGVLNLTSDLPYSALDYFSVTVPVPPGVAELQISHARTSAANSTNILDWGLADASGTVLGWGGGNTEAAIIGVHATSRSYLLPPSVDGATLTAGNWSVIVGKPRIAVPPEGYSINVTFLDAPTLAPQPERRPYARAPPLDVPAAALAMYAGDFHVHSAQSGDALASATPDAIAAFARGAGLDFVHLSDHNTVAVATFLGDAQSRFPAGPLLLPGVEFTTYHGHSGALFTSQFTDFRVGAGGVTMQSAADAIHAQGGLVSINHFNDYLPGPDLRNDCVGCTWAFGLSLPAAR